MTALICCLVLGQAEGLPWAGAIDDAARLATLIQATTALEDDPALLESHRGYVAYLQDRPGLRLSEDAYAELMQLPGFRSRVAEFEEALIDDSTARVRFDAYYEALAEDGALSESIDILARLELRAFERDARLAPGFAYLKNHYNEALEILRRPVSVVPVPESLFALKNRLLDDDEFRVSLHRGYERIERQGPAHRFVYPWWARGSDASLDIGLRHGELVGYLAQFGQRYWIWHRRNQAWAAEPRRFRWVRHHHALVRRDTELRDAYYTLLDALREFPDAGRVLEERWVDQFGGAKPWPPEGRPRRLMPIAVPESTPLHVPDRPLAEISRPSRPTYDSTGSLQRPSRPKRPEFSPPQASQPLGPKDLRR